MRWYIYHTHKNDTPSTHQYNSIIDPRRDFRLFFKVKQRVNGGLLVFMLGIGMDNTGICSDAQIKANPNSTAMFELNKLQLKKNK